MTQSDLPLVVFNAQLLSGDASYRSAGISTYIANVLQHFAADDDGLRYLVYFGNKGRSPRGVQLPVTHAKFPTGHPLARVAWEQFLLPWQVRRVDAALLHAPAFVGPLWAPCPQVITIHDLSFLRHPQFFRASNRLYLTWMTGLACRRAAAVIAVSHFTAREAVELLHLPAERVHVVHNGVDPMFRPLPDEDVERFRQEQALPPRFILHLGTLEPRKNIITLVRAFARLRIPDVHLVIAGGKGWFYDAIFAEVARLGIQTRVHFPGYVPTETLPFWYNAAHVVAYISHYEGFGLPVLEAMASGTPTLTGTTTSLPEVAGDGAHLVPPNDVAAVAEGLRYLIQDDAARETLRQRGLAQAARFSWQRAAQQTIDVYHQTIRSA